MTAGICEGLEESADHARAFIEGNKLKDLLISNEAGLAELARIKGLGVSVEDLMMRYRKSVELVRKEFVGEDQRQALKNLADEFDEALGGPNKTLREMRAHVNDLTKGLSRAEIAARKFGAGTGASKRQVDEFRKLAQKEEVLLKGRAKEKEDKSKKQREKKQAELFFANIKTPLEAFQERLEKAREAAQILGKPELVDKFLDAEEKKFMEQKPEPKFGRASFASFGTQIQDAILKNSGADKRNLALIKAIDIAKGNNADRLDLILTELKGGGLA